MGHSSSNGITQTSCVPDRHSIHDSYETVRVDQHLLHEFKSMLEPDTSPQLFNTCSEFIISKASRSYTVGIYVGGYKITNLCYDNSLTIMSSNTEEFVEIISTIE